MSNPRHLAMLLQGADAWNAWREQVLEAASDSDDQNAETHSGVWDVDLSGADLRGLDLSGTALAGVTLRAANLSDADLRNCDLEDADLALCDLSGANLGGARFQGADFSGARLDGAWLQHADLRGALGLTSEQISLSLYGDRTRVPPYLDLPVEDDEPVHFSFDAEEELSQLAAIDIYDLLGTPPDAPVADIRKAFRNLAKKYHPDVNPGDANAERRFAQITEAYRFALAAANARTHLDTQRHSGGWTYSIILAVLALALPVLAVYWFQDSGTDSAPLAKSDMVTSAVADRDPQPTEAQAPVSHQPEATTPLPVSATVEAENAPGSNVADATSVSLLDQSLQQVRNDALPPATHAANPAPAAPEPAAPAAFSQPWEDEWQSLRSSTDLRALQDYIQRHPDTSEANQARARFRSALGESGDTEALRRVARDMPSDAPETAMINQRVAALVEQENLKDDTEAWLAAKEAGTVAAYRAYLAGFANGRYAEAANKHLDALQAELREQRRDELAWAKAQREKSAAAYEQYLKTFPNGAHADDAEQELVRRDRTRVAQKKEEDAWAGAKKANTRDAFQSYLKAYPKGRYALVARKELAKYGDETASSPVPAVNATPRRSRPEAAAGALRFPTSDDPFLETFPRP